MSKTTTTIEELKEAQKRTSAMNALKRRASQLGITLAELVSEIDKGGKPEKDYILIVRFDRMKKMLDFVRSNFDEDEVGVWRGSAIDPEFRGIGRAPTNHYVLRSPKSPFVDREERIDVEPDPE